MNLISASSLALAAVLAAAGVDAGENPDCKLTDITGYTNCRTGYHINHASDAMWCVSESDCLKVFPGPTAAPVPAPTDAPVLPPVTIASAETVIESSSIAPKTMSAAVVVVASMMMMAVVLR